MKFSVHHRSDAEFTARGLRNYYAYRDLGIHEATDGLVVAHVIRAQAGEQAGGEWHYHEVEFQMIYILRGWVRFEYEDVGEVLLEAGSCVHQRPQIRHRELAHSDDLELLEIASPAVFKTVEVNA
ncbi:MAG: cupin domain-containing protein [Betaproteobacteria bacterium]